MTMPTPLSKPSKMDMLLERLRVVRADYLAVIALSVGRPKDLTRILALIESGSVKREEIGRLAGRFDLSESWKRYEKKFSNE